MISKVSASPYNKKKINFETKTTLDTLHTNNTVHVLVFNLHPPLLSIFWSLSTVSNTFFCFFLT